MNFRWTILRTAQRLQSASQCCISKQWRRAPTTYHPGRRNLAEYTTQASTEPARQRRKDNVPTADTIYALSTAPGKAAIAIVRISGPACLDIYGGLCPERPFPIPRTATLRKLLDPVHKSRILDPGALVLYFPGPRTVTGEDLLELHVHGGPAIVRSILEAIPRCLNSRPRRRTADYSHIRAADAGEFTKRAFYNGIIDLTQAEALGETLAAETEQQRRLAVAGSDTSMALRYEEWRKQLLYARGELEALIDFSEDQHFEESPATLLESIATQIMRLQERIKLHVINASRGELLRNGITVALLGAPNAGKSSLLNLVVGREAAIVSNEPGTTRDIVEANVDIGGWLVRFGDMAGLRRANTSGPVSVQIGSVEREGIRRARERALQSDVIVSLIALKRTADGAVEPDIDAEVIEAVQECRKVGKTMLYVVNKADLLPENDPNSIRQNTLREKVVSALQAETATAETEQPPVFFVSCREAALWNDGPRQRKTESGLDPGGMQTFLRGLIDAFTAMTSAATGQRPLETTAQEAQAYWNVSLSITHRQSAYLAQCLSHLRDFLCMHDSLSRGADQDPTRGDRDLSHHVDNHADLVGEVVKGIDIHQTDDHSGLRQKCNIPSAVPAPGDHPPLSAYRGVGPNHQSPTAYPEEQFDIVHAAEHLRYAASCLAKITGRGEGADAEEVLGVVFEK